MCLRSRSRRHSHDWRREPQIAFGEDPEERAKILADKVTFEPMLQAAANLVVGTTEAVEVTVDRLLGLIER